MGIERRIEGGLKKLVEVEKKVDRELSGERDKVQIRRE